MILHGLFGSLENWLLISRKLAEHFQVWALDQRNHGHSPNDSWMSYPSMAEDVVEFMDEYGLALPHILGHSMGGKTAMELALAHEERVETLIVADIAPRGYPPQHQKIFDALLALNLGSFQTRKQIETALEPTILELAMRQFLLKNAQRDSAGSFRWLMNLKAIHENYDRLNEALPEGRRFSKPALFVRGELSDYIRDRDLALIHRLFPQAEVRTIARAEHWLHAEMPEAFLRNVQEFLNRQIGLAQGKGES